MKNVLPEVIASLSATPVPDGVDIQGQTSPKVKALLHRLAERLPPGECYFEIGCLRGSTLVSALIDLKGISAYACDNFSQFKALEGEKNLKENLAKYASRLPNIAFRNMDCFELAREKKPFDKPVGVYFYDGAHQAYYQAKAIAEFERHLSREAVFVVDDWNWDFVRQGTWMGLDVVRPVQMSYYELPAHPKGSDVKGYWNGIGVFHLTLRK